MFCIGNRGRAVSILVIALLVVSSFLFYDFDHAVTESTQQQNSSNISSLAGFDKTTYYSNTTTTETPKVTDSPVPNRSVIPDVPEAKPNSITIFGPVAEQPTPQPTSESYIVLNETVLLSAINLLRTTGGSIVLQSDLAINHDIILPSNITLTGSNDKITIFLSGHSLGVAANATNVTFKDLTIDGSGLGDQTFIIAENATNVLVENIIFRNFLGAAGCLLNFGNQVTLRNISFNNIQNVYPILINGSNVSVSDCVSSDNSLFPLIAVGGGLSNISVIGNAASNRPLFSANYGLASTKNLWIENNTVFFPNGTYALLIMGGMGDYLPISHANVTVKGNFIKAAPGAFNAIAIYGLTTNATVIGNTVDMSLSGHNGIAISSGINVTVTKNVVFGCNELTEGGIEVESNPVHNRQVGFSDNVTVVDNTVYNSTWGIYVRVMCPDHPNWNGTVLLSKNIVVENNTVYDCQVGVNLLYGDNLTVRNNNIMDNMVPFAVDVTNVSNFTVTGNIDYP